MTQTNKTGRANAIKGTGIEGSMSRSNALGANDPRGRRGPQRELEFTQRFDPTQFDLDASGRVSLRTSTKPRKRIISPAWHPGSSVGVGNNNSPFWGYTLKNGTYNDACAIYLWWPIPDDCDRTQPLELEFNHLLVSSPSGDRRYKLQYSSKAYTSRHGTDWDPAAVQSDTIQQDVTSATAAYTELGEVEWKLAPAVAFPDDALAVGLKIERESPSGGTDPSQNVVVGRITLSYSLRYHHVHSKD